MAGERRKLTATEKGKGKVVEEEKKDKGIEGALIATSVAERPRPGPGVVIHDEPSATALESPAIPRRSVRSRTAPTRFGAELPAMPRRSGHRTAPTGTGSRKRRRDDAVVSGPRATTYIVPPTPPSPPPIADELFSKALQSVVTVASVMAVGHTLVTAYRTGFILIDEESYSVVLTTSKRHRDGRPLKKHFVYFGGEKSRTEAYELQTIHENDILILIVQTDKRHEAVKFSRDPLGYEVIFTVCAMSGLKLNDRANAPLVKELEGSLGIYKGTVGTPRCDALDASYRPILGSGKYFQLSFCLHDDIITLENVDAKKHTAEIAVPAPVFRLNGEIAGVIFSDGGWIDSKFGLLTQSIILSIETCFGSDWEEHLKEMANDWLEKRGENNEEELTL